MEELSSKENKKTLKAPLHFAELATEKERGEMPGEKVVQRGCRDLDLRSRTDQSLAIYCLGEDSLIDLDDLACKLLPASVLHECTY